MKRIVTISLLLVFLISCGEPKQSSVVWRVSAEDFVDFPPVKPKSRAFDMPTGTKFKFPDGTEGCLIYSSRCFPKIELAVMLTEVFEAGKQAGKKELMSYYKERSLTAN